MTSGTHQIIDFFENQVIHHPSTHVVPNSLSLVNTLITVRLKHLQKVM